MGEDVGMRRCPCSSLTLPRDLESDAQTKHLSKPRELLHPGLSSWQRAVMEFRAKLPSLRGASRFLFPPMSPATSSDEQMKEDRELWLDGCLRHTVGFAPDRDIPFMPYCKLI